MSGATGPRPVEPAGGGGWAQGLRLRTIYGTLLAALAVAVVLLGDRVFLGFVAVGAAILSWEWMRLCRAGRFGRLGLVAAASTVAAAILAFADRPAWGIALCVAAAVAVHVVARRSDPQGAGWGAAGIVYVGLPVVALVWLRGHDASGERLIAWLMLSVAVTDIAAFFAGRLIGGPKLAPRLSPKKTWAGLVGAMVATGLCGAVFAALDPTAPRAATLAVAGVVLAVVAQAGDLFESAVKRHFGAKDASQLIPGHGGLLDRVDGLVVAAGALAFFQGLTGGGLLAWQ
ncbi:MAG: phosphatidate cytidylyltransferase [Alphaproteobacteria bacterium]|nr:phosphatidate cytidylyltransferase [Alphaproteobacteria bacterium]